MKKLYKYLLYILPLVLIFSYFPVISLGSNETMNFELSLPLLWLVVFDVISLVMVCKKYRKELFTKVFGSVLWWLFPLFATLSVCWSLNVTRGILTVGVMWALFFAVVFLWDLRKNLDDKFWKVFWRWFFGSAMFACAWCVVQCILDVSGVSQEASLLCDGCVYQMFGFPHPNGFAIEPQFMGNLLVAPILVVGANLIAACPSDTLRAAQAKSSRSVEHIAIKFAPLLFFIFSATLFLTFSRGAIYACVVGLVVMLIFVRPKLKQIFITLGIFAAAFLFTLNLQGILTASSPTSDTYVDGVAKVLNHLSLGIIDVRGGEKAPERSGEITPVIPVENSEAPVENSIYSGYVEESTDTRVRLASAAIEIWHQDFKTALVGVGIGGAGQALYNGGFSPAPKEIVQNEYAEILLETGSIGISLFALIVILAIRVMLKNRKSAGLLIALLAAYGVTLLFFSGLPNALNIVLIPALLVLL